MTNLFQSVTTEDGTRTESIYIPRRDQRVSFRYYCKRSIEWGINLQVRRLPEQEHNGIALILIVIALLDLEESYLGLLFQALAVDTPALQPHGLINPGSCGIETAPTHCQPHCQPHCHPRYQLKI